MRTAAALAPINQAYLWPGVLESELEAAAFEVEEEHDHRYRVARQQYLQTLEKDESQPRHVRGWARQERIRMARIERAQQQGLGRYVRGAIGRFLPGGSTRYWRGVPGMDVGHKLGKHNQHDPKNFRLENASLNRARPGISRRLGLFHKYREAEALEAMLEHAAERMEGVHQAMDVLHAIPDDVRDQAIEQLKSIWEVRGYLTARLMAFVTSVFVANPQYYSRLIARSRAKAARQIAIDAGRAAGLQARRVTHPPGMSPAQVREYERRQRERGYVPGRHRQRRRQREMELEFELEVASRGLS